jgi:hypothetical protein
VTETYKLIGYEPAVGFEFYAIKMRAARVAMEVAHKIIDGAALHGQAADYLPNHFRLLRIGTKVICIVICCYKSYDAKTKQAGWYGRHWAKGLSDMTLIVALDKTNVVPERYYLLPSAEIRTYRIRILINKAAFANDYQMSSLDSLYGAFIDIKVGKKQEAGMTAK